MPSEGRISVMKCFLAFTRACGQKSFAGLTAGGMSRLANASKTGIVRAMIDWYDKAIRTTVRIARIQRSLARLAMVGTAVLLSAVPSMAGLQVCNETHETTRVALGRIVEADWKSQGWWRILPGKCKMLLSGALKARYYYIFSTDGRSGTWGGNTQFCTANSHNFTIAGRMACAHRGYDNTGFFEVDTRDRSDWTQYLSD